MTEIHLLPKNEGGQDRPDPEADRVVALPHKGRKRRGYGGALFGGITLLLLLGGLAIGAWRHYQAELEVAATLQRSRTLVPEVRVATVRASDGKITVTLPATTTQISLRAPTAISKSAMSISAIGSRREPCWQISPPPNSTTRLRKPRRRWPRTRRHCSRPRQVMNLPKSRMQETANWSSKGGSRFSRATTIA
jgi:hypothetical protein